MEYFCKDSANGDRETFGTLEAALAAASACIGYYRREALNDTEWMNEVEDVVVGTAEAGTVDADVVTHRATAFGDSENGYDYRMETVPVQSPSVAYGNALRP